MPEKIVSVDFAEKLGLPAPERQGALFPDTPPGTEEGNPEIFTHPTLDRKINAQVGRLPDAVIKIARGLALHLRPKLDGSFSGYPGYDAIARRGGVCRKTVKRHLQATLEAFGIRAERREGTTNYYTWTPADEGGVGTPSPLPQQSTRGLPVPYPGDSQSPGVRDSQSPRTGEVPNKRAPAPPSRPGGATTAPPPTANDETPPDALTRRIWACPETRAILHRAGVPSARGLQRHLDGSPLPRTAEALARWIATVELVAERKTPLVTAALRVRGVTGGDAPPAERVEELRALIEAATPGAGDRKTGAWEEEGAGVG